ALNNGAIAYDNATNTITYTDAAGNEMELALNTTNLAYDSTNSELVYTNSKGEEVRVDISELVAANTTNTLRLTGNELTSTVNGVESSVTLTDANITSDKGITSNTINLTGETGATLKDVTMEIKPGGANQVLITDATGDGVTWVDQSVISPATTNELASSGNTLTSTVNGEEATTDIINTVANSLNANNELVTTVNGVDGTGVDLTPAIQANQKTTVVEEGTGVTVTSAVAGNVTTYTVSADAVDAEDITNGKALTSTDLDLSANASTALLKDVTANIKTGAVTSDKILDGTVATVDLADRAVTAAKINNDVAGEGLTKNATTGAL